MFQSTNHIYIFFFYLDDVMILQQPLYFDRVPSHHCADFAIGPVHWT
jgi:hypothetical protein